VVLSSGAATPAQMAASSGSSSGLIDPAQFAKQFASTFSAPTTTAIPGASTGPDIYWGQLPAQQLDNGSPDGPAMDRKVTKFSDNKKPFDQAMNDIYSWTPAEQAQWGKRLYSDGIISDPNSWSDMVSQWQNAVNEAGNYYAYGKKKVTPWGVLDMWEKNGNVGASKTPTTTTHTSVNYAVPDKSDAQAAIQSLFQEQMGRDPNDQEMDKYTSMLMSKYKSHPQTQTEREITDSKGNTTTTTTGTSGAYNPAVYLQNQAEADPEWGAYQAATTYFNAMQQALGAPSELAVNSGG
jgi:hypothetical protein